MVEDTKSRLLKPIKIGPDLQSVYTLLYQQLSIDAEVDSLVIFTNKNGIYGDTLDIAGFPIDIEYRPTTETCQEGMATLRYHLDDEIY